MLTAHGLSEESLKKSAEEGASYYAPKEKMHEIDLMVADVLAAIDENKSPWALRVSMTKDFTVLNGESRNKSSGKRS
jgi:hypothetical protein